MWDPTLYVGKRLLTLSTKHVHLCYIEIKHDSLHSNKMKCFIFIYTRRRKSIKFLFNVIPIWMCSFGVEWGNSWGQPVLIKGKSSVCGTIWQLRKMQKRNQAGIASIGVHWIQTWKNEYLILSLGRFDGGRKRLVGSNSFLPTSWWAEHGYNDSGDWNVHLMILFKTVLP